MHQSKVSARFFVTVWTLASCTTQVATALGRPVRQVERLGRRLRRLGVQLKELPLTPPSHNGFGFEPSAN